MRRIRLRLIHSPAKRFLRGTRVSIEQTLDLLEVGVSPTESFNPFHLCLSRMS